MLFRIRQLEGIGQPSEIWQDLQTHPSVKAFPLADNPLPTDMKQRVEQYWMDRIMERVRAMKRRIDLRQKLK